VEKYFRTIEISDPRFETDGLRQVTVYSDTLGRRGDVTLFVPPLAGKGEVRGLLVLLHGVHGSHWAWAQKAGVHRTALRLMESQEIKPFVIAMPSDGLLGQGSGYLARIKENSERWIVEDVPRVAALAAECLAEIPKLFLAGFSMGGFGALRIGSKYADRFAGISAHSAITHISQMRDFVDEPINDNVEQDSTRELDLLRWMKSNRPILPLVRFDCGLEDKLLSENRLLHTSLMEANIDHVYKEFSGGHDWAYWEAHIGETLRFVSNAMEPKK